MSKNIEEVYVANPITTNESTDLMYFGRSPYNTSDDSAMLYSNFAAQFATSQEVQQGAFNVGIDSGVADAYVVTLSPAVTSLTNGLLVCFSPLHTSLTVSPTLKINGLAAKPIVTISTISPLIGDLQETVPAFCIYDSSGDVFILLNGNKSIAVYEKIQSNEYISSADTGTENAYVTGSILGEGYNLGEGSFGVVTNILNTNTGDSTLNMAGSGAFQIVTPDGSPLSGGEILSGKNYLFLYVNGAGVWTLINSSKGSGVTPQEVQRAVFNTGTDTGVADAYVIACDPVITEYTQGLMVYFTPLNANTSGGPTLDAGAGEIQIQLLNKGALYPGDIDTSIASIFIFTGSTWSLINPKFSYVSAENYQKNSPNFGSDVGTTNAYQWVSNYGYIANFTNGSLLVFVPSSTNTGSATMDATGAPRTIVLPDGVTPLSGGEMVNGGCYLLMKVFTAGDYWTLLNPSITTFIKTSPSPSDDSSLEIGTGYQNVLGYDVVLTVYLAVASATTASISLGVGPSSTPTEQIIVSSLTTAALSIIPVTIYLPNGYYALLDTTGTISVSISGQQVMPV